MAEIQGTTAEVLNSDPRDSLVDAEEATREAQTDDQKLVHWIMARVGPWKDHRNANYGGKWDMYERLWRGIWSENEQSRKSERSRIVSPALSEAVENGVSEIEEAVFGRGEFFDMRAERTDDEVEREALRRNEATFKDDLSQTDFTEQCADAVTNAAVYGSGIAEIVRHKDVKREMELVPAPMPAVPPDVSAPVDNPVGAAVLQAIETEIERPVLRSVNPRNFIPDPSAAKIEDMLGCAVEEDVGIHVINEGIRKGIYKKIQVKSGTGDTQTKPDPQVETPWVQDVVPVIRYYGKVPRDLLFPPEKTENLFPEDPAHDTDDIGNSEMVEAIVVIANSQDLLMAEENQELMRDRGIVSFQWDRVPGRFWGRGICEKGVTPQRMLDAELRARIDALAFVAAPMMAMDASRLPRGFKLEVYPGKNVLLAGNPAEILKPFKFGELDANSGAQVELLDRMVQRATGSIDTAQLASQGVGGDARSGAVSMAMSGIVKRNKRTLMRYVNTFLGPALRKLLVRYMQYDADRYVPINTTFNISSTMGIMQREYETMQLTALMNTMQPGTSEHLLILIGLVQNSGMQNRDQVLASLKRKLEVVLRQEMAPPVDPNAQQQPVDPVALEMQRMDAQIELAKKVAELNKLRAETGLIEAKTQSEMVEPQLQAQELAMRGIYKVSEDRINAEFDRRMRLAELALEDKRVNVESQQVASDERIADKQIVAARVAANKESPAPAPQRFALPIVPPFLG